jgi:hypothetical protein
MKIMRAKPAKNTHTKQRHSTARTPVRSPGKNRRNIPERIGTVEAINARRTKNKNASVKHTHSGSRNPGFSDSYRETGNYALAAAARLTGGALALGSILLAAPIAVAVTVLSSDRGNDLKQREYRDERGQIHHHTHTYFRDHSNEAMAAA